MADKITNTDILSMIEEIAVGTPNEEVILTYCAKQKDSIASKAAKAKERNAEKKAAGDELRAVIADLLTDEPQNAEMILEQIDGEDLTVAKIRARLSQLVTYNMATKVEKTVDGKKRVFYTVYTPVDAE